MTRAAQKIETPLTHFLGRLADSGSAWYGIPLPRAFQISRILFVVLESFRHESECMVSAQSKLWGLLCKDRLLECLTAIGKLVEIVRGHRTAVGLDTGVDDN